jgi:hypothetical protein
MRYRTLSLAVALLAAPIAVQAQPFHGIYIGAGAGYNLPIDIDATTNLVLPSTSTDLKTTGGFVGLASVGYALGNGMRFEIEGSSHGQCAVRSGCGSAVALSLSWMVSAMPGRI